MALNSPSGGNMYKHILVATDGSRLSDKGVSETIKLAKTLDAKITAVHVVDNQYSVFDNEGFVMPDLPDVKRRFVESNAKRANAILDKAKAAAAKFGVLCNTVVATGARPYESI